MTSASNSKSLRRRVVEKTQVMSFQPTVSIVINTDARAQSLKRTLDSLRWLDYPLFEVCVVYGPSPDGTKELLEQLRGEIKVAHCSIRNLSASRNIGIAMAAGEILAFLDDDSIPEPEWISRIIPAFERPDAAACGGFLHDNTGVGYQWRFGTANRLGATDDSWDHPPNEFNFPYTANFPHVMANSAFRKTAVVSVGGFDEQYEYFLDETDLICRLVDHGWRILPISGAAVHHKFSASRIRDQGVIKSWYAIVKSKIYFSLVNSRGHHNFAQVLAATQSYIDGLKTNLEWGIAQGLAQDVDRDRFNMETDHALQDGIQAGLAKARRLADQGKMVDFVEPFLPFKILNPSGNRNTVCLLSKTYPPAPIGGIGRHIHQLARSIARLGHQVHVLTRGSDHDTVDFEDGVWVHRIYGEPQSAPPDRDGLTIPNHIWVYSASMLEEVKTIAQSRTVDAVFAPIWDCEGIAFLLDGSFRLVTGLYTTFQQWLNNHPHRKTDTAFMHDFIRPMIALETLLFEHSDAVLADSRAIITEIENAYAVKFEPTRLALVPLGLEDWTNLPFTEPSPLPSGAIRVLFVGRLEERKGIDIFLTATKNLLKSHPEVYVDIVGDDTLKSATGLTYRDIFEADHDADSVRDQIRFLGEVSESELRGYYRACDIFVAPSRFESFGLILLEAMMFGKAVIGCRAGGMAEIVEHGVCGLLAEPGDASSLFDCLLKLIADPQLRERLGAAARRRYESALTADIMASRTLGLLPSLSDKLSGHSSLPTPATRSLNPSPIDSVSVTPTPTSSAIAPHQPTRYRIAVINSILARNDAVSAAVRDTYHMLVADPALQVSIFASHNDLPDVPCHIVHGTAQLLLHPDYLTADLIIWHFGIYYELFNAIFMGNGKARKVIVFHNITPRQFVSERLRPVIDRSLHQRHHLRYADEVWNVSAINADAARAIGVPENRLRVIPIPVEVPALSTLAEKNYALLEVLFIGRFVAAKGVLDLVEAAARLLRNDTVRFRITLAGNLEFSDALYVEEVHRKIAEQPLTETVQLLGTVDDETLQELYRRAHILAIPSFHEGFCKPVIEGLRAGCIPIGYASYNLPEIAYGLGRMVPPGNVQELSHALDDVLQSLPGALRHARRAALPLDRGQLSVEEFDHLSHDYVARFTRERIGTELRSHIYNLLTSQASASDYSLAALS